MQHDPTARPTLRLLDELTEGWADPHQKRAIAEGRWDDVQPLTHLAHPVLEKCRSVSEVTNHTIRCAEGLHLVKVRFGQWRAGVWLDPDGVSWVVAAGLAKGDHQDRGDFYEHLARSCSTSAGRAALLPTDDDRHLLKRETASRLLTDWELAVQGLAADLLAGALDAGSHRLRVPHPKGTSCMAEVELTVVVDQDIEEYVLSIMSLTHPGSRLAYLMEHRLLVSIAPPEQDWDVAGRIYSAMETDGHGLDQIERLHSAARDRRLLDSFPGQVAHRVHRRHVGDAAVNGKAVRSLCGTFFVPRTDPFSLPECAECARRHAELPGA